MDFMEPDELSESQPTFQSLKNLIAQILSKKSAYDCMPINSLLNSVGVDCSVLQVISILIDQDLEEILIWDDTNSKWIWMFTLVDAVRIILFSLKQAESQPQRLDFSSFHTLQFIAEIPDVRVTPQLTHHTLRLLEMLKISELLDDLNKPTIQKRSSYLEGRLRSTHKDDKLSRLIYMMICDRVHRILIVESDQANREEVIAEEGESSTASIPDLFISVLNFKDILLYLLHIANESQENFLSYFSIGNLLNFMNIRKVTLAADRPLLEAFYLMTDIERSLWCCIVDQNTGSFMGILFREDFRRLLHHKDRLNMLSMSAGEFLNYKEQTRDKRVPQWRQFKSTDVTRDILWKVIMTTNNTIICFHPETKEMVACIGLMELFSLYVQ